MVYRYLRVYERKPAIIPLLSIWVEFTRHGRNVSPEVLHDISLLEFDFHIVQYFHLTINNQQC